ERSRSPSFWSPGSVSSVSDRMLPAGAGSSASGGSSARPVSSRSLRRYHSRISSKCCSTSPRRSATSRCCSSSCSACLARRAVVGVPGVGVQLAEVVAQLLARLGQPLGRRAGARLQLGKLALQVGDFLPGGVEGGARPAERLGGLAPLHFQAGALDGQRLALA